MEKEKFKAMAKDLLPVINDMMAVLKKHGVKELANITADADGYFTFVAYDGMWDIYRVNENADVKLTRHDGTCSIDEVFR